MSAYLPMSLLLILLTLLVIVAVCKFYLGLGYVPSLVLLHKASCSHPTTCPCPEGTLAPDWTGYALPKCSQSQWHVQANLEDLFVPAYQVNLSNKKRVLKKKGNMIVGTKENLAVI